MMKKNIYMIAAAAAMAVSCQKEIQQLEPQLVEGRYLEVTATYDKEDSKTVLNEASGNILWNPADEIKLFQGSSSSGKFTSQNTEDAMTATFTGVLATAIGAQENEGGTQYFWAVYPYAEGATCDGTSVTMTIPSTQVAQAGSFAPKMFPSIAKSQNTALGFYNVCGGIRFKLTKEGVRTITITSNGGEAIAGQVSVSMDENGRPVATVVEGKGVSTITLTNGENAFETGKNYYITLLPGVLSQGFTLKFDTSTETASRVVSSSVEVKRKIFGDMKEVDENLTYESVYKEVDLGLSVKWASFNLGATKPEEYGSYYAWGEIETKESYNWDNYSLSGGEQFIQKKYPVGGVLINEDDAATQILGGKWAIPTRQQWVELKNECTWTLEVLNGINGYRVSSKVNSNSIFIPAANHSNYLYGHSDMMFSYWQADYWDNPCFNEGLHEIINDVGGMSETESGSFGLASGRSIRPIFEENQEIKMIALDPSALLVPVGGTYTLSSMVARDNSLNRTWSSSDSTVATVDSDGTVTGKTAGIATITVTCGDKSATCNVTVVADATLEMVDLGLSVKWASFNLGATTLEGYGLYYQWGDTQGYGSDTSDGKYFNWKDINGNVTYKWCNGSSSTLTKYNTNSSYGTVDNKTSLEMEDDAASVALGGDWRMPTDDEWTELRNTDNCTWTWTMLNGIKGYLVQSKKSGYTDKWIFLPAAGYRYGSDLKDVGSHGRYWSSTINRRSPYNAWSVYLYSDNVYIRENYRYDGLSVRPVSDVTVESTYLSVYGTANCYIVSAAGDYKFNATVKGGSTESVGTVASAEVLWESFGTDVAPSVGDLVNTVSYKDGYIKFTATSARGNAVIAAKDSEGNILWSWHIWLTDKPEDQVYNNNAGTMMDRNLGATSATKGDVKALGLLYQWGRKDPFLGGNDINSNEQAASTLTWPSSVSSNSSNGTISYAVSHPTTFIMSNTGNMDWYYTGSSSTDNTRWRTSSSDKGIYDPCPAGYRVPDGGDDGVWSKAFATSSYWQTPSNWDSINYGMDFTKTDNKISTFAPSVWYPAAGCLGASSRGSVGSYGHYWSCSPDGRHSYVLYFYYNGRVYPSSSAGLRASGLSVRCLQE